MTRNLEEIEKEIAETEAALENVKGSETEVYARIVGYYRAVRNWNKGKAQEFKERKMFVYDGNEHIPVTAEETQAIVEKIEESKKVSSGDASSYEFFMRKTCPNCPPVKNYMATVDIEGKMIDVDTEDGLKLASEKGVFAAPTVIFYDGNGKEIGRGHNVDELIQVLEPVALSA